MSTGKIVGSAFSLCLVVGLIAGCGDPAGTRADFRAIDVVVKTLSVGDLGQVTVDRQVGKRQVIEGQAPLRAIGVMTDHMSANEVQAAIEARVAVAGYAATSRWGRVCANGGCSDHRNYHHPTNGVGIELDIYGPGEQILNVDARGKTANLTVPPNHVGLWLTLIMY